MALTDDILDETVRHAHYLERHKASVIKKLVALMSNSNDEMYSMMYKQRIEKLKRRDLDKLLRRIKVHIKQGYEPVIETLDAEIRDLSAHETRWQKKIIDGLVPVELDWEAPSGEQIYAAAKARPFEGLFLQDWYNGLSDGHFRRVKQAVMQGYVEGQTTDEIVQQMQQFTQGRSRRAAETAARTALTHTSNVARNESYRRNRRVIRAVEWVATLDGRTSAICRARDGKTYPVDAGARPPAHPACRSTTIPVVKSLRELGIKADTKDIKTTRASMNGQVSSELNYDRWLRKQPKAFQEDVLGREKAKLFRAGLKMDRFVDEGGREFTLKEIEKREKTIWSQVYGTKNKPKPQEKPTPQPEPTRKRQQVFDETSVRQVKNLPEARQLVLDYISFEEGLAAGSKPDAIRDTVVASREVMERFDLPKMKYFGGRSKAPVRYRRSRNAMAAFSMEYDHYLLEKKGANKDVEALYQNTDYNNFYHKKYTQVLQTGKYELFADVTGKKQAKPSEKVRELMFKRGTVEWSPVRTIKDIGYHENGHRLHGFHRQEIDSIMSNNNVIGEGWSYLVSKYAQTNHKEYIAETFTIYMQGDESQFYRIHPEILKFYRQRDRYNV